MSARGDINATSAIRPLEHYRILLSTKRLIFQKKQENISYVSIARVPLLINVILFILSKPTNTYTYRKINNEKFIRSLDLDRMIKQKYHPDLF